jgi:hypothetical protein
VKVQSRDYKSDKPANSYSKIKKKLQKKSYHTNKVKLDKIPYDELSVKSNPPVYKSAKVISPSRTFDYEEHKIPVDSLLKTLPVDSL